MLVVPIALLIWISSVLRYLEAANVLLSQTGRVSRKMVTLYLLFRGTRMRRVTLKNEISFYGLVVRSTALVGHVLQRF